MWLLDEGDSEEGELLVIGEEPLPAGEGQAPTGLMRRSPDVASVNVGGRLPMRCSGPGRNGDEFCSNPTESKTSQLCRAHNEQNRKHNELRPLRTRTSKSTCVGPGQAGGELCGRQVYSRPVGQDDGICKTHYDQMSRRGFLGPIERRLPPIPELPCWGPGQDGNDRCDRPAEGRETLLCSPHDRQHKRNDGVLKPIRRINTPDGPCIGPGPDGSMCGRPISNKTHSLCGGHYGQHNRDVPLTPLKLTRKSGEVTRCKFPGCRYNDAPDAGGYCRHHWRQHQNGSELKALRGNPNRGNAVRLRDESGNKFCPTCEQWKPEDQFNRASRSSDGLDYRCRRCQGSAQKKARYGISLDEFEELLRIQGGRCAICPVEVVADGRRLAIDHDHRCCPGTISCGKCIRGILCPNCNRGLGLFQEDFELVKAAAAYLLRASHLIDVPLDRSLGGAVPAGLAGTSTP